MFRDGSYNLADRIANAALGFTSERVQESGLNSKKIFLKSDILNLI